MTTATAENRATTDRRATVVATTKHGATQPPEARGEARSTRDHQAGAATWDELWQTADEAMARERLDWERRHRRWLVFHELLRETFGDRKLRCVELGAGEGDFSVLLAEAGHDVTLVDFSEQALRRAEQRFARIGLDASYEQGDLFEFAEREAGRFDVAVSLGVAEHFSGEMRRGIIDAHRRVLRTGGVAMVSVPNALCVPYRFWKLYLHARRRWRYGYEAPFTPGELRHTARRVGFAEAETYNTGFGASVDNCLLKLATGRRRGWGDGPAWLNTLSGWCVNLIGRAA